MCCCATAALPPRTTSAERRGAPFACDQPQWARTACTIVATGYNTSHATIAARLRQLMGWQVEFAPDAPTIRNLPIDTSRLDAEFGPALSKLSADLPTLLGLGEEVQCSQSMKHLAA